MDTTFVRNKDHDGVQEGNIIDVHVVTAHMGGPMESVTTLVMGVFNKEELALAFQQELTKSRNHTTPVIYQTTPSIALVVRSNEYRDRITQDLLSWGCVVLLRDNQVFQINTDLEKRKSELSKQALEKLSPAERWALGH